MPNCLCSKLQVGDYSAITLAEASLLQQVWTEAPNLFSPQGINPTGIAAQPPTPPTSEPNHSSPSSYPISESNPSTVARLQETFPRPGLTAALDSIDKSDLAVVSSAIAPDVFVRIFLTVGRSDLLAILASYSLAALHPRGASTNYIVERVRHAVDGSESEIRSKVNKMLWRGRQWQAIVDSFQQACRDTSLANSPLPSIMCVIGKPSIWERSGPAERQQALLNLAAQTDIVATASKHNGRVLGILQAFQSQNSFVNARLGNVSRPRTYTTTVAINAGAYSPPITAAVSAVSQLFPTTTPESASLLLLISLIASPNISLPLGLLKDMLQPRHRWDSNGGYSPSSSETTFQLPKSLPTTEVGFQEALTNLNLAGAIFHDFDNSESLTIEADVSSSVLSLLLGGHFDSAFWRREALLASCHMIPFQYLEPSLSKEKLKYVAPLLERCIEDVRTKDGFQSLPNSLRTYVALCLIEVSKWPGLTQKRRAVHAAQEVMAGIKDDYAESNIAQRQVVLDRLGGKMGSAIHGIDSVLSHLRSVEPSTYLLHASAGHATVERALNSFQQEQLGKSLSELDTWSPLSQVPAPAEVPVLLRINLLRAKMLRFQGNFTQSHNYLVLCSDLIREHHPNSLLLDKDKTSVACELVYVLRELDRPEEAEQAAVRELSCLGCAGNERSLLLLAYAEALFAQGRLGEAEAICQQPQESPSKMTRLLSFITMAKIRYTQSRLTDYMSLWTQALQAMNKFPPTSGHATRAIHLSIPRILNQQGVMDTAEQTQVMVRDLESLLDRAEAKYWIPGLRHWCDYLTSA